MNRQPLPDKGYYEPDRVNDRSIGLVSTDQAEDIMMYCDKKTEVICQFTNLFYSFNTLH
jgi:hypothetical protein